MNGSRTDLFDSAHESRADQVVPDIEDAIDPAHEDEARAGVVEWLADGDRSAWVRINDRSMEFWDDDVAKLAGLPGLLGVMLAKTEAAEQVTDPTPSDVAWARDFLADFEARGQVIRDGSDTPRLGRARKIERLAATFGVEPA